MYCWGAAGELTVELSVCTRCLWMGVVGGGGGGGTRDGRPGGLAYVIGKNGEEPDETHGGCSEDEVSNSEDDELVDLRVWTREIEDRKNRKAGSRTNTARSHGGAGT